MKDEKWTGIILTEKNWIWFVYFAVVVNHDNALFIFIDLYLLFILLYILLLDYINKIQIIHSSEMKFFNGFLIYHKIKISNLTLGSH